MTSCYLPIKGNSKKTTELGELGKVLDCSYWHVHSIKNSWKGAVLVICVCCHFSGLARNPWYVRILWGGVFSFMSKALNEMSGIIWDYQHTALIKLLWYLLQQLFQFLVLFCHKPLDAQLDGIAKIQRLVSDLNITGSVTEQRLTDPIPLEFIILISLNLLVHT